MRSRVGDLRWVLPLEGLGDLLIRKSGGCTPGLWPRPMVFTAGYLSATIDTEYMHVQFLYVDMFSMLSTPTYVGLVCSTCSCVDKICILYISLGFSLV